MSWQERFAKITEACGPELKRILGDGVQHAVKESRFAPEAYARLRALADEAAELVAPFTPCRRGCSMCCYQAVGVTGHEAGIIGRYIGQKPAKVPQWEEGNGERMRERFTAKPCVFLEDGECSIYAVRPMVCRTHFSIEDDPNMCDIAGVNVGAKVRYLDLNNLIVASGVLGIRSNLADIREWFPHGRGELNQDGPATDEAARAVQPTTSNPKPV